ncbi:MAG: protein TolR [Deltaproteobacteria bacterium CG_4_10_14_3_um_filter_60_8]|nr:MAG: protein TolR [Desulfobacterales bacterium CG2_30_60_27]PIY20409.1 MAG: protein TolR [Deltaproteobacteria bacterium CG_4_10_14_3_um_filter_60_8]
MGPMQERGGRRPIADINVTPLVDVMLVLLIIFMVTAPMMTQGLDVNLPETTTKALPQEVKPIVISINAQGEIFLDKIKTNQALLKSELAKRDPGDHEKPIFLEADRKVSYGLVVEVMADIKDVGFDKLGMVTRPREARP